MDSKLSGLDNAIIPDGIGIPNSKYLFKFIALVIHLYQPDNNTHYLIQHNSQDRLFHHKFVHISIENNLEKLDK